jgi:hypothetical protein
MALSVHEIYHIIIKVKDINKMVFYNHILSCFGNS